MAEAQAAEAELRRRGNAALSSGAVQEAIDLYTSALSLSPDSHLLYSNRSAAHCRGGRYAEALADADRCVQLAPSWAKGHSRRGAALEFLGRFDEAVAAYEDGLRLQPDNRQLRTALQLAHSQAGNKAFFNPFADPRVTQRIYDSPKLRHHLDDADFRLKLQVLQRDPGKLGQFIADPRITECVNELLGLSITEAMAASSCSYETCAGDAGAANPAAAEAKGKQKEVEVEEEKEEEKKEKKKEEKKKESVAKGPTEEERRAMELREAGNAAYRRRELQSALELYRRAERLAPDSVAVVANIAAVQFEEGRYADCVAECQRAVEIGRRCGAEFQRIARVLARAAAASERLGDLLQAKRLYDSAVSECRLPQIVRAAAEVERRLKERDENSRLDPALADSEREAGDRLFAAGSFADAAERYTEAIARNPSEPSAHCGRAECYAKLSQFHFAVRDCDSCLRLQPHFLRAQLLKGACLLASNQHFKAAVAYRKALELDAGCEEATSGLTEALNGASDEERQQQAAGDPEVQRVLSDPGMQTVLQQMRQDPAAVRAHLADAGVRDQLIRLSDAGILRLGHV